MVRADGLHYGTIVVVGGGCYGSYYVRQLLRARERGALAWRRVIVVDRDPACMVSARVVRAAELQGAGEVEVVVADWAAFFDTWLDGTARAGDAIVPSPLMPHLFFHWLERRARRRWPARRVARESPDEQPGIPWQRVGDDGTRYVSFAEWICPVNCVEPNTCPHTRGPRDWSMPVALARRDSVAAASAAPPTVTALFRCIHRAYGVGMIDVDEVLSAARALDTLGSAGDVRLLVGTVSHCHGALGTLIVE